MCGPNLDTGFHALHRTFMNVCHAHTHKYYITQTLFLACGRTCTTRSHTRGFKNPRNLANF